jgi:hypothetical protein
MTVLAAVAPKDHANARSPVVPEPVFAGLLKIANLCGTLALPFQACPSKISAGEYCLVA